MGSLGAILNHPDDFYPLLKLKIAVWNLGKQIPPQPHWAFCYSMLHKVSRSFSLVIQQLGPDLRNAVCIFYLVLRALDTVGGTKDYKHLMDQFHHLSTAFLELGTRNSRFSVLIGGEYTSSAMVALQGLTAKVIDRTKTMSDVYGAFFDFSSMLKSKVEKSDPNATKTLKRLESIQTTCRDSGMLNKRKFDINSQSRSYSVLVIMLFILLPIILAYLSTKRATQSY